MTDPLDLKPLRPTLYYGDALLIIKELEAKIQEQAYQIEAEGLELVFNMKGQFFGKSGIVFDREEFIAFIEIVKRTLDQVRGK